MRQLHSSGAFVPPTLPLECGGRRGQVEIRLRRQRAGPQLSALSGGLPAARPLLLLAQDGTAQAAQAAEPERLYDVFQIAFSPLGVGIFVSIIAVAYAWDLFTASQGRTLLGQKYEEQVRERYCIRFSVDEDGFYESPSGGSCKIEKGVPYIEEFDTYDAAIILGRALQREFGKDKVTYQTFKINGEDYVEKKGERMTQEERAAKEARDAGSKRRPTSTPVKGDVDEKDLDALWKQQMEKMKLTSMPGSGLENVEVTVITGENACRLCNGRGVRGCSTCSTPTAVGDDIATGPGGQGCGTCRGKRVMPCEYCGGSGIQKKSTWKK